MIDQEHYEQVRPFFQEAARVLNKRLLDAFGQLGDAYLVRARVEPHRIKPFESVKRKARRKRWTFSEALEKCPDLVGYRLVCNNLQDVRRAAELLEQSLRREKIEVRRQDYIRKAKGRGYRAIHLDIRLPISIDDQSSVIGCEVQIRSLLQDSWARLSRVDIYTDERNVSPTLLVMLERLADLLHVADGIADDIRREISRPRKGRRGAKGAQLSASSIAFLFRSAFGTDAPDYLVRTILREFADAQVRTDGLEAALTDKRLIQKLRSAYTKRARYFGPDPAQIFRWVIHVVVSGEPAAVRLAEAEGREARDEVDVIYRSEVLSGLPETWEELADWIERPAKDEDIEHDIREWANALDTLEGCGICGTGIVDVQALAEALSDHYGLKGEKRDEAIERLEYAIRNSGVEVGGWGSGALCAYHNEQMSKDD